MQTFLPYPDYAKSAACLDRQRLGKQRVEVLQILNVLHEIPTESGKPRGWRNHPVVKMWRGYEAQLIGYGLVVCDEWIGRGYRDATKPKIEQHLQWLEDAEEFTIEQPPWFGDEAFHLAHQSNLVRKDPAHYRQYFPGVPDDLPYIYPEA